jgi:HSP20 family molecular chaperone IbpA
VAPEEVRIVASERNLAVAGQRKPSTPIGTLVNHCERVCGVFHRSLDFPQVVDPDKATAEFHQGVCRIVLPKKRPEATKENEGPNSTGHSQLVIQVTVR